MYTTFSQIIINGKLLLSLGIMLYCNLKKIITVHNLIPIK